MLLTAYADTDAAILAINEIGLDYYFLKPWDPPEDQLFPVTDDLLGDWWQANPDHTSDVRVVGHRWSDRGHELKTFLARNHVPYRWYDVERDAEAERLVELAGAAAVDLPLVLVPDGKTLRSPSTVDLAGALGCGPGRSSRSMGTLRIGTRTDGDHLVVEIADTGAGMPPDVMARAFDACYTTKDVGKGLGLGLDIARRIVVERHGGTITIDSRPGQTVLRVRLPYRPTGLPSSPRRASAG